MDEPIKVNKDDILQTIYFILAMTQRHTSSSMAGALSSKGDLIGGIFDRWINTFPERIVFEKIILPMIETQKKVSAISDFYSYNPKIAGIAPDLIGIKVDDTVIPFCIFNEQWMPVDGKPQVEVKTFKKQKQKMVSLRNQGYDGKYLVMVESDLRIDYLLPFMQKEVSSDDIYQNMIMDDNTFIKSNHLGTIEKLNKIDSTSNDVGTVQLIKITKATDFMSCATYCDEYVSIQSVKKIEEKPQVRGSKPEEARLLSEFCDREKSGFYRFNFSWYDNTDERGVPFYKKSGSRISYRTVDFYTPDPAKIKVLKKSLNSFYITPTEDTDFNGTKIQKDKFYRIELAILERGGGSEYFLQKELVGLIPDAKDDLCSQLKKIIEEEK